MADSAAAVVFKGDALTASLAAGSPPETWGLNLNLLSPPAQALQSAYVALQASCAAEIALLGSLGAYFYPPWALHVTLASAAPFTGNGLFTEAQRGAYSSAWQRALLEGAKSFPHLWPRHPFPLVIERLVLDKTAAYFAIADTSGSVARLREALRGLTTSRIFGSVPASSTASSADGADLSGAALFAASGFKAPVIVHSTFLRFSRDLAGAEAAAAQAAFEALALRWKPLVLQAETLLLVHERAPYMHLHLEEGGANAAMVALRAPFA